MSADPARAPRVSVGLPVYNGEPFIAEAIEAILGERSCELELIISDNASDDGTEATCRRYAAMDARVRYVRNAQNVGLAANFSRLVDLATAPYFKLATADDVSPAPLVERCVEVLDQEPDVVLCYAPATIVDERGRTLRLYDDDLELDSPDPVARFEGVLRRLRLVNVLQGVMRAAALRQTGRLCGFPGSDVLLVAELALHGKFRQLADRLFVRRMHAQAASSLTTDAGRQAHIEPRRSGRPLVSWRRDLNFLAAIRRAPVSFRDRIRLLRTVLRMIRYDRQDLLVELRDVVVHHHHH